MTISFMASSRNFTIQVSAIDGSLLKRVFTTILVETGQMLGVAKRIRGPSDYLRCFYDRCTFQCPSMKSMTDHVGKHYGGLRPSVDRKKATWAPKQPSSRPQPSPSAESIRNELHTSPKPSPRISLQARDPSKVRPDISVPASSIPLSPQFSSQLQTRQVSLHANTSVSPRALSSSLQISTRRHYIQSGVQYASTPLKSPRSAMQTQPGAGAQSIFTTALPLIPSPRSISPPGIQDQEPDGDNKSEMNSLFSAEFSSSESDSNSPEFPLLSARTGLSSLVDSKIIVSSFLGNAKSNSIISHPGDKVTNMFSS